MAAQKSRAAPRSKVSPSISKERKNHALMPENLTPKNDYYQSHRAPNHDRTPVSPGHVAIPTTGTEASTSEHGVRVGVDEDACEQDDEDSDHLDVHAPPSHVENTSQQPVDGEEVWAGPDDESDDALTDLSNSESGDPDPPFDLPDDDDDYDAVDRLSVTSDDSKNFEADVEQEILAAGEAGIDWDNEDTYGYTTDWRESQYFVPAVDISMQPTLLGFSLLDYDLDDEATPTAASFPQEEAAVRRGSSPQAQGDWPSSGSSSSDKDDTSPLRRISQATGVSGETSASFETESGYETDDEEFPFPTVSSPAVTLSIQTPQRSPALASDRRITFATPPRKGLKPPVLRQLTVSPKKTIAYTVDGPLGRVIHFKTPKGSNLKWIDLPRRDTGSDMSSPSSPTMINLEAALQMGNTRTGASITDVIYGQMFRQYHCSQLPDVMDSEPSSFAEFARVPLLNGVGFGGLVIEDTHGDIAGGLPHDDALDLIDFDGGVIVEGSAAETTPELDTTDAEMTDITDVHSSADSEKAKGKAVARATDPSNMQHQVTKSLTSNTWQELDESLLSDAWSSPLKRRPSPLSQTTPQSPTSKRTRVGAST